MGGVFSKLKIKVTFSKYVLKNRDNFIRVNSVNRWRCVIRLISNYDLLNLPYCALAETRKLTYKYLFDSTSMQFLIFHSYFQVRDSLNITPYEPRGLEILIYGFCYLKQIPLLSKYHRMYLSGTHPTVAPAPSSTS